MTDELICDACKTHKAVGVCAIPLVPVSMSFCQDCLNKGSYPMEILIANTVCVNGLANANAVWKKMVTDSLLAQGKTLEWFNIEVAKGLKELDDWYKQESDKTGQASNAPSMEQITPGDWRNQEHDFGYS